MMLQIEMALVDASRIIDGLGTSDRLPLVRCETSVAAFLSLPIATEP